MPRRHVAAVRGEEHMSCEVLAGCFFRTDSHDSMALLRWAWHGTGSRSITLNPRDLFPTKHMLMLADERLATTLAYL